MTELGSIYEQSAEDGPRGVDLQVEVRVSPRSLGRTQGVFVSVPLEIEGVRRADPHADGARVRLHLPAELPAQGALLRLRGLGGLVTDVGDEARSPGDLYLRVVVDEEHASSRRWIAWIAVAAAAAAAALLALS